MQDRLVNEAYKAFCDKKIEKSFDLYKKLSQQMGNDLFKFNIDLCKKILSSDIDSNHFMTSCRPHLESTNDTLNRKIHYSTNILFPTTKRKLISYIAEDFLQKGNISSLFKLQKKYNIDAKDLAEGIICGTELKRIAGKKITILIAGHDLRFVKPFIDYFEQYFEVLIDKWDSVNTHDSNKSKRLLDKADVVWCEWCCENAVWYSKHVLKRQRLVIRLHKFEIETIFPENVQWKSVDTIIFIADGMFKYANAKFSINCKQLILYNGFDVDAVLDSFRGKRDYYSLALLGYVPYIKRLDRSICLFEKILNYDSRYSFHLKGKSAKELPWVWKREQRYFELQDKNINKLYNKGAHITKEPYDASVWTWLGQKGFILSSSDIEGSHQAIAEGMACGTLPVIFGDWVNKYQASSIYPRDFCFTSESDAIEFINKVNTTRGMYEDLSSKVKNFAHENFNIKTIMHGALNVIAGKQVSIPYVQFDKSKVIIVFTDLSVNIIDGSSIWLMSVINLLLIDKNTKIVLVTKEKIINSTFTIQFNISDRVIIETFSDKYSEEMAKEYVEFCSQLIDRYNSTRIIVRCLPHMANMFLPILGETKLRSVIYYVVGDLYPNDDFIKSIHAIFVQTEESKRRVKDEFQMLDSAKIKVLRPMILENFNEDLIELSNEIIISYAGKMCADYMALEMVNFINNSSNFVKFLLCIAKYNRSDGSSYIKSIKKNLNIAISAEKLLLFEAISRDQVMKLISTTHLGWSIRSNKFADSCEISTKVLEYCSLSKPVLLNKHISNVTLLGEDYPLYCDTLKKADQALVFLKNDPCAYREIAKHCKCASDKYRLNAVYLEISSVI